jgi:Cytochrome c
MKLSIAIALTGVGLAGELEGCSSGSSGGGSKDATSDAPVSDAAQPDGPPNDAKRSDAGPSVTGVEIAAASEAGLQGAPGDALQLQTVLKLSDGTKMVVPYSDVNWTAPVTVTAQDPNDAGPSSVLPEAGAEPTAFFVSNTYRITQQGVLFITAAGTASHGFVTVSASVPDAGTASAKVTVLPAPVGDPTRGATLFQAIPGNPCASCHGPAAAGSPPVDGGEAGAEYLLPRGTGGELFPYPAPPLNNTTTDAGPNLAADPTWSAGLLGMAAQADIDNNGVALRIPMPEFFDGEDGLGGILGAQDFADIYAWLKTQTH